METRVIVVGGGAAGLLAASFAAKSGAQVLVLEKLDKLATKIRISGKGRCNITNAMDIGEFIDNYPGNGRFLYSAFNKFSNQDLLKLLAEFGLETKTERGQRVFPKSDDADQVANILIKIAVHYGVQFELNTKVTEIAVENGHVIAVKTNSHSYSTDRVIITTGGASYPKTGSSGDGYQLAKSVGHKIQKPLPALVGLKTAEKWVQDLSGLSLRNVSATIDNGKLQELLFGEMQFSHFGVTGPIILTLSRQVALWLDQGNQVKLMIDLKPALTDKELDLRIQRDFQTYSRKQLRNGLDDLLPKSLIPVVIKLSQIDCAKPINQINKEERLGLVQIIKSLPLTITRTLPLSTAIVTAGGIQVNEINPKTMESKLISGLFFAGEVIDIDGITGGFNLQAAFSTGVLAGISAAEG